MPVLLQCNAFDLRGQLLKPIPKSSHWLFGFKDESAFFNGTVLLDCPNPKPAVWDVKGKHSKKSNDCVQHSVFHTAVFLSPPYLHWCHCHHCAPLWRSKREPCIIRLILISDFLSQAVLLAPCMLQTWMRRTPSILA